MSFKFLLKNRKMSYFRFNLKLLVVMQIIHRPYYNHSILLHSLPEKMEPSPAAKISKSHWSQGLYASMNDSDLLIYKDDLICIIKDKYPKAQKHFLVMPMEKLQTLNDLSR
jgi:hypothetical protein